MLRGIVWRCVVLNKYLWYEYGVLTREPALLVITISGGLEQVYA